jgi:two-component sensor histidine kinase
LLEHPGLIQFRLDIVPVFPDVSQAVTCGLLINELLLNSLKHAFPGGRTKEVQVQLSCEESESTIRLRVSDDGIGLPADFEMKRSRSLGFNLVSDLAGQLGGRIEIDNGPGAAFTLVFKPQTKAIPGVAL